jgi:hypothetical protein
MVDAATTAILFLVTVRAGTTAIMRVKAVAEVQVVIETALLAFLGALT